jgi:hypothetical protein
VADFFDVVGLGKPPRAGKTAIRENVSIGAAQAVLLRELSARDGADDTRRHRLRSVFQQDLAAGAVRNLSPFPVIVQSEIAEQFSGDWASLVRSHLPNGDEGTFQSEISRYDVSPEPYAGGSLADPCVGEEALRSLEVLILRQRIIEKSELAKVVHKLLNDPWGVPHAALRRMHR